MKKIDQLRRLKVLRREARERQEAKIMKEQYEENFANKKIKNLIPHPTEPRCWIVKLTDK